MKYNLGEQSSEGNVPEGVIREVHTAGWMTRTRLVGGLEEPSRLETE
jgi:hypothetical protein